MLPIVSLAQAGQLRPCPRWPGPVPQALRPGPHCRALAPAVGSGPLSPSREPTSPRPPRLLAPPGRRPVLPVCSCQMCCSWAWDCHPTVWLSCLQRPPAHCPLSRQLESLFPNPGRTDSTPAVLRSPSLSASAPSEAQNPEASPAVLLTSRSHGIPAH